jgi:hypothetical protein
MKSFQKKSKAKQDAERIELHGIKEACLGKKAIDGIILGISNIRTTSLFNYDKRCKNILIKSYSR